ncbi:KxYKxGKxW signal peptide domain-containing protein [Streptococcus suis]|uniref:KxYKxGKxW signal peptide domain-containing protein n=1 Tax=Streptococcus suis TaxID=1307 RepID=UPI001379792C|nr:KxYKxGKxW signal peptide domain-containing protein [Streptococcus suis]
MFDKEKNQGRFRMWKSGKQWLYSGLIIIVLIGVGVVGGSGLIHNTEAEVAEKSRVTYLDGRQMVVEKMTCQVLKESVQI